MWHVVVWYFLNCIKCNPFLIGHIIYISFPNSKDVPVCSEWNTVVPQIVKFLCVFEMIYTIPTNCKREFLCVLGIICPLIPQIVRGIFSVGSEWYPPLPKNLGFFNSLCVQNWYLPVPQIVKGILNNMRPFLISSSKKSFPMYLEWHSPRCFPYVFMII